MPLNLIQIKAGIVKDITPYSAGKNGPFWVDGDNVRFRNGYATKIGGWENEPIYSLDSAGGVSTTAAALQGVPRKINYWRDLDGDDNISVGTSNHLYIIRDGGIFDITPLANAAASLTDPFTTVDTESVVTVADTGHGMSDGDFVVFSGASAVNGIAADTLNRYSGFQITYVDADSYTIETGEAANASGSGGGSVTASHLIGADEGLGIATAAAAYGWGAGTWGASTWGTPRTSSVATLQISQWTTPLWGEDLLACVRNGQLYYWDASAGTSSRAVLVSSLGGASNVPTTSRLVKVSFPDRHAICFGCNPLGSGTQDPMLIRWSDQEDYTDWTPTATNTSGDQRLEIGTKIVTAMPTREEMFVATDEAVYGMAFVGPPFTFSFRLVGTNCGAVGINTMMNVDGDIYWMGKSDFFLYNGSVAEIPCPVQFYVFDRLNKDEFDKCFAAHNKEFNEVTWFYVSQDNTDEDPEPDSYVSYNYRDNAWSIGSMDRTCWFDSFGFRKVPFSFSKDGYLYNQETGNDADGVAMNAYVKSSPLEMSQTGNELMLVDKIVPDLSVTGNLNCTVYSRKYPDSSETTKGPFTISSDTGKVSMRSRGRQMSLELGSNELGSSWSIGDFRFNVRSDGLR